MVAILLSLVLLTGVAVVGAADHAFDIEISDDDPGAADVEHTWTVQFDGFEGDAVDRIELDYSGSDVEIEPDPGVEAFDVEVVGGESVAVEDVTLENDVVTIFLEEVAIDSDAEFEVTSTPIFTNPDDIGYYEAAIQIFGDDVETTPGTVEFSIGSGYVGTVTDVTGEPLEDVTVTIESTGTSTTTDVNGDYAIEYDDWSEATLEFERDGYATATMSETGALGEVEAVDDVRLHGQIELTSIDISDNTSDVTDVEYAIEFDVEGPVAGVESISVDLSDANTDGLSTENVSDEHVGVSIDGQAVGATLHTEQGDTTLGIELDEPRDIPAEGSHQITIGAMDNPEYSLPDDPYELVVGLHDERSTELETALTHTVDEFTISRVNADREAWWYLAQDGSPTEVVPDGDTVYFSAIDHVHAVNVSTGEDEWVTEIPAIGEFSPDPTVAGDTVYVPDDAGNVTALDAATGDHKWTFEADDSIRSDVAVDDKHVYFGGGPWDTTVYAVDRDTGVEAWSFDGVGDEVRPVAIDDGTVYAGSADERLYAIDAATGHQEWSFEADGMVTSEIEVVDGTIYTTGDEMVYAIDPETESPRWTNEMIDSVYGATVGDDMVYVIVGESLVALALEDGEVAWSVGLEGPSVPAVSGSSVFVGDYRGLVFSLDANTGERQDIFGMWGPVDERPTVAGEMFYVSTRVGSVHSFDARLPAEPTGTVSIDAPITADQGHLDVDVTFEDTESASAYLSVESEATGETYSTDLTQSGTESIETGAFGEISEGDTIRATLYETTDRETLLDDDSATVQEASALVGFEATSVQDSIQPGEPYEIAITEATGELGEPYEGVVDIEFDVPDSDTEAGSSVAFVEGEGTVEHLTHEDATPGAFTGLEVRVVDDTSVNATYDIEIVPDEHDGPLLNLTIDEDESDLHVEAGDPVIVVASVENVASWTVDEAVTLAVDDIGTDYETVSLNGSEATTVTLEVPTSIVDDSLEAYEATVAGGTASTNTTVSVVSVEGIKGILGDVTGNGEVTLEDTILVQEHVSGVRDLEEDGYDIDMADMTRDGHVTDTDSNLVAEVADGYSNGSDVVASEFEVPAEVTSGEEFEISGELTNEGEIGAYKPIEIVISDGSEDLVVQEQWVDMAIDGVTDPVDMSSQEEITFTLDSDGLSTGEYEIGVGEYGNGEPPEPVGTLTVVEPLLADFEVELANEAVLQDEDPEFVFSDAVNHDGEPFTGDIDLQFEQPDGVDHFRPISFDDGEATQTIPINTDVDVGEYADLDVWAQELDSVSTTYDIEIVSTMDTPTPTSTPAPTSTETPTPTPTPTETPTPALTQTATPTESPTATETPVPEPTQTTTETPAETPTATDEPDDTPSPTPTEDQPGFGVVVALTALFAAALLGGRRRG